MTYKSLQLHATGCHFSPILKSLRAPSMFCAHPRRRLYNSLEVTCLLGNIVLPIHRHGKLTKRRWPIAYFQPGGRNDSLIGYFIGIAAWYAYFCW